MIKRDFGPGILVAAAFIGPGTVTACTVAGASFGFALLWALVFATVSTIVLQDMAARLGAGAGLGLGEAMMRGVAGSPVLKWCTGGLVFAALLIGNSAYESGNLTGGALGVEAVMGSAAPGRGWAIAALAALAAGLVLIGRYETLERVLIALVAVMSIAFSASAVLVRPDLGEVFSGLVPNIPDGATLTVIALIGTTIVPYNLFLHAAAARRKWPGGDARAARAESRLSIGLGGLVSILILSTAAASLARTGIEIESAAEMAGAIEPVAGEYARYLVGIGLLAAGLTSAITAPMATAFAMGEIFGEGRAESPRLFKITALVVIAVGAAIALSGIRPVSLILIAQFANGLLLPIIATVLLLAMNRVSLLGEHANSALANLAGGAVVVICFALGMRAILLAFGVV